MSLSTISSKSDCYSQSWSRETSLLLLQVMSNASLGQKSIKQHLLPWYAPEAEPGAGVSSSHAVSEILQLGAASGSVVVAGWAVTPAVVVSHEQQGLPLASSSSGLSLGLKVRWAPGPQEPLISHPLKNKGWEGRKRKKKVAWKLAHTFGN